MDAPGGRPQTFDPPSFSSPARRAVRRCNLSGVVRDLSGKPVKDARIEIHSRDNGQVIFSGYSGMGGMFEVPNLPSGSYELVTSAGLAEARQSVSVDGASLDVSVLLPDNAPSANTGNANSVSVAQMQVPERARNAFRKAQEAMRKTNNADVEKYLAEALSAYPRYADALTLRGILKLDKNQFDDARLDLEQAIQFDPNYALAYIALGSAYNVMSHWDDALRVLTRGTSLSPTSWQAYLEAGKALLGKRDFNGAMQQLSKAQSLRPDFAMVHLLKADAMVGLKDYANALTELETYLKSDSTGSQAEQARHLAEKIRPLAINIAGAHLAAAEH